MTQREKYNSFDVSKSRSLGAAFLAVAILFANFLLCLPELRAESKSVRQAAHWRDVQGKLGASCPVAPEDRETLEHSLSSFSSTDLLLSDSVTPARFTQERATIAPYTSGYISLWEDNRDGATSVYQQLLDASGNLSGGNQLFRSLSNGDDIGEPKIVRDGLGKLHLFVRDQTHGLIYGARLGANLSVEVSSYLVNDSSGGSLAGLFDVAVYPDGRLIIVWEDYSVSGNWIRARSYSAAGVPGAIVQVSSAVSTSQQWSPKVAVDPSGGYLIVWEDYRNAQADIYGRQYDASGATVGSDLTFVPGGPEAAEQIAPAIAFSSVHKFVVGWIDERAGQQFYTQRFDAVTGLVGTNTLINAASSAAIVTDPTIATLPNGTTVCGWASFAATNNILMTSMSVGFLPQTEFAVNAPIAGQRWGVHFWPIDNSSLAAVWTAKDVDEDIRAQRVTTAGAASWTEKQLNDDLRGTTATTPDIAAFTTWNHLVAFVDARNDGGDIFVQPFTSGGLKLGSNVRVNQDPFGVTQSLPALSARPSGGIITWRDDRPVGGISGQRIFGRLVDAAGGFPSSEFLISDTLAVSGKAQQSVAINLSGKSLVCWLEGTGLPQRIFARWVSVTGALSGVVQLVDSVQTGTVLNLSTGADSSGRMTLAWVQQTISTATLFARRYGTNEALQSSYSYAIPGGSSTTESAVGLQPDGGLIVAWTESQGAGRLLRVVGLTPAGVVRFGPVTIVSTSAYLPRNISVSVDELGRAVLCWIDNRSGSPQATAAVLHENLTSFVPDFSVASIAPAFMRSPVVSARFGRAHFGWLDPRGDGLEVYASTTLFDATDVESGNDEPLPRGFGLSPAYPNPFNPKTTISFDIPATGPVRLAIYNLLGAEVAVLHDGLLAAGRHTLEWNASADGQSSASGIYFVSLQAGHLSDRQTIVLLK